MTPEERDLISGLFDRLKTADTPDKDREAEDLIRRKVAEVPAAPYLLTQTVLVQEQALNGAQARIAQLEKQLADAQRAGQAQAPASSGSFLGRIRRPWETPAASAPTSQPTPPVYAQSQYASAPAYAPAYAPSGGGFLQSAMATAAGVAGGALLFQGIEQLMGHGAGPFNTVSGSPWGGTPVENVTVNNYYGDAETSGHNVQQTAADDDVDDGVGYQEADYQDDGGGDLGSDVDYT